MAQFDCNRVLSNLMTPEVVSALGNIREHKGKTSLLSSIHPDHFAALVEVAKIQSARASNRIENISTSDKRLRELMLEKADPRNRDEHEIAGYRYVLDLIHESHDDIPITPSVILQLHRDLYRYSGDSHAGTWKDSDNVIAERTKETYYEALAASSQGWWEGKSDYAPFVTYMLGIIDACYRELANRFSLVGAPSGNEEAVRTFFDRLIGSATKREIMDANPGMSQRTLERILSRLQREGMIEKIDAA